MCCRPSIVENSFYLNIYKCQHTSLTFHDKPVILVPKTNWTSFWRPTKKKRFEYMCLAVFDSGLGKGHGPHLQGPEAGGYLAGGGERR